MSISDLSNQEKLEEIYKLTIENNEMLHSLRNRERVANILRVVYWLIILGALGGVYYYIKPAIEAVNSNKNKIQETLQQFEQIRSQFPEARALQGLLDQLKGTSQPAE